MRTLACILTIAIAVFLVAAPAALTAASRSTALTIRLGNVEEGDVARMSSALNQAFPSHEEQDSDPCRSHFVYSSNRREGMVLFPYWCNPASDEISARGIVREVCENLDLCERFISITGIPGAPWQAVAGGAAFIALLFSTVSMIALWIHWWTQVRSPPAPLSMVSVAGIVLGYAVLSSLINWLLGSLGTDSPVIPEYQPPRIAWDAVLVPIFVAPIIEEFFFRAWLLRKADWSWSSTPRIVISTLLFALSHRLGETNGGTYEALFGLLSMVGVGLAMTHLWIRFQSLSLCVGAHMVHNAIAVSYNLTSLSFTTSS